MKTLNLILTLLIITPPLFGQHLLTKPNKSIKGLREGIWAEYNISMLIDSTGEYHVEYGHHFAPKNVVAEGLYVKSERQGFWKEYWIVTNDDTASIARYKKGGIKSIKEYKNGVPCGLIIEYHKNGSVRAIGQYETYPVNDTLKIDIPDWTDPKLERMKDTIIYIRAKSRPLGEWQFFKPDGTIWK